MKRLVLCEVCFKMRTGGTCVICERPVCKACAYGRSSGKYLIEFERGPSFGLRGLHWRDRVCSRRCAKRFTKERREDLETLRTEEELR